MLCRLRRTIAHNADAAWRTHETVMPPFPISARRPHARRAAPELSAGAGHYTTCCHAGCRLLSAPRRGPRPDPFSLETMLASPPLRRPAGEPLALAIYDYSPATGRRHVARLAAERARRGSRSGGAM